MELVAKVTQGFEKLSVDSKLKQNAVKNIEEWLSDKRLVGYRPYIEHLIDEGNFSGLLDAFWRMMPFGTGGRRGPVGAGPNRINPHTISLSAQGHCDYLKNVVKAPGETSVVVAYDVRQFHDLRGIYKNVDGILAGLTSKDMARECAMTYAANGIIAYVVAPLDGKPGKKDQPERYISTPELSFLIRELKAAGGINISASHNHPDDNGGKFYNIQGGQEIPPHDEALLDIVEKVKDVRTMPYEEAFKKGLIRLVPPELHKSYIDVNVKLCQTKSRSAKVAYTPLCGTGMTTVKETLEALGFKTVLVESQSGFDGSFASIPYRIANPEVPDSMEQLKDLARKQHCDIGLSTDPDADRLGIIVPDKNRKFSFINGNDIGVLLIESILASKKRSGTLPAHPIFINTLVTSSLQREIARRYGCQVVGDLMVGFKYMGDVLGNLERSGRFPPDDAGAAGRDTAKGSLDDFVFTCEESHGYLLTPRVRDKDACGAAVHLTGLVSELKEQGKTIPEMLRDIYRVYGFYRNQLRSLVMEGIVGLERIGRIQDRLRENPPQKIAGMKVLRFVDNHKVGGPLLSSTDKASRNVLLFELQDEDSVIRLIIRPSGTEPKTKIYVEVPSKSTMTGCLSDKTPEDLAAISDTLLDKIIAQADVKAAKVGNAFIKYCLGPDVLGDVYPEIPNESLLVSDLVPVDHKLNLCIKVLPALLKRLGSLKEKATAGSWLDDQMKPLGSDYKGLVRDAALAWIEREALEGGVDTAVLKAAKGLFEK